MSNMHPHDLHQLIRTWLLAEDPYGMRQDPMMGRAGATPNPARSAGEAAVEQALKPGARVEPTVSGETARAQGLSAVDREMDRANTEAWRGKMEGRKADKARAGQEGRAAVADAVSPANVRAMIKAQAQQPQWSSPEESAGWANALGQSAVEGARPPPQGPAGWFPPGVVGPQSVVNPEAESTNDPKPRGPGLRGKEESQEE